MQVGETEYLVDVKKIPYFASFLRSQQSAGQSPSQEKVEEGKDDAPAPASVPKHNAIAFFDVINCGVENGFRQFFRRMPAVLADYHVLCETLDFLGIDVLGDTRTLKEIMKDLKAGKSDWDEEWDTRVRGRKDGARDAAFRLLYVVLKGDVLDSANAAYNMTVFVVSHYSIFKYRARKMVREAFEERFVVSDKQRRELDRWPKDSYHDLGAVDETTGLEESDRDADYYYYYSDYSD